jgi:hypothetical protein
LKTSLFTVGVTDVSIGDEHTCAIRNGAAYCWGSNVYGQLGGGDCHDYSEGAAEEGEYCRIPALVSGLENYVTAIAAGEDFSCAVQSGTAKCWGRNDYGQLGDGTTTSRPAPGNVCAPGQTDCNSHPLEDVEAIGAGGYYYLPMDGFACAQVSSGGVSGVKCWGHNSVGQLGATSGQTCGTNACSRTPINVTDLQSGVTGIAVGSSHACATTSASVTEGVRCWGGNQTGQLGDWTATNRPTPVNVVCDLTVVTPCDGGLLSGVATVAAGYYHTCAGMTDGAVTCWGFDLYGQLGDGIRRSAASTPPTEHVNSVSPVFALVDTDRDGCTDNAELGSDPTKGGLRDPNNYWDYFNPTGDGQNRADDIAAVRARNPSSGGEGSEFGDPFIKPTSASSYHTNFDRQGDDVIPSPDGRIIITDIVPGSPIYAQYFHDCGWH